jgi:hypothetical protein
LCSLAASLVTVGGSALANPAEDHDRDEDRPPVYQPYGTPAPNPYRYAPEDHDRYVPQDNDRYDPREQARLEYERDLARCGGNWKCRNHVQHEWAERRHYRY